MGTASRTESLTSLCCWKYSLITSWGNTGGLLVALPLFPYLCMTKANNFIEKFSNVEQLKKYFEEKGVIAEVVDTPCGPAFVAGYSQEEFDKDKAIVTEISQHYNDPMSLYRHLSLLKDMKEAGKENLITVKRGCTQYLLSVDEQRLYSLDGNVVEESKLSVKLSEEDLLKLWNLEK